MARWQLRRVGAWGVAAAAWLGMIGCGGPSKADPPKAAQADNGTAKTNAAKDGLPPVPGPVRAPTDDPLYQPFTEAVRDANDPPAFVNMPADKTLSGKPTFKLLANVQQNWDDIRFTTPDGKRIDYTAVLETDGGPVEIALRPDVAPNHVRSFVSLIRAGYYDGMRFDRIHHEVSPDAPNDPLDYIEGGCPLDKGDPEDGSIGYWLKPEVGSPLHHEIGAVGAMHGSAPDSAACKFYIMLCDAPYLDGHYTVFGKLTRGLDLVRTMFTRPVIIDDTDPPGHNRPKDPIIIRRATVQTHVAGGSEGQ
jgi:cyclophilin family peptidyl-prolyl cis-trans isomerase